MTYIKLLKEVLAPGLLGLNHLFVALRNDLLTPFLFDIFSLNI